MVKASLIIASHMLIIPYLAIILSHMPTRNALIGLYFALIPLLLVLLGLLFGLVLSLFIPIPLFLSFMLFIQFHSSIMYSHISNIGSPIVIIQECPSFSEQGLRK